MRPRAAREQSDVFAGMRLGAPRYDRLLQVVGRGDVRFRQRGSIAGPVPVRLLFEHRARTIEETGDCVGFVVGAECRFIEGVDPGLVNLSAETDD